MDSNGCYGYNGVCVLCTMGFLCTTFFCTVCSLSTTGFVCTMGSEYNMGFVGTMVFLSVQWVFCQCCQCNGFSAMGFFCQYKLFFGYNAWFCGYNGFSVSGEKLTRNM